MVLTMGHCVYGADDHEWWYIHAIAPRQCQSGNVMVKPYGTLKMDYATTTQVHKENNYDNFDIAVIELLSNMGNRSELLYPSMCICINFSHLKEQNSTKLPSWAVLMTLQMGKCGPVAHAPIMAMEFHGFMLLISLL